jgi:hypothetical protein
MFPWWLFERSRGQRNHSAESYEKSLGIHWQGKHADDPFIYSEYVYLSEKGVYMVSDLNQDDSIYLQFMI